MVSELAGDTIYITCLQRLAGGTIALATYSRHLLSAGVEILCLGNNFFKSDVDVKLRNHPPRAKPSRPVSMPPARPLGSPSLRRSIKQTSTSQISEHEVKRVNNNSSSSICQVG